MRRVPIGAVALLVPLCMLAPPLAAHDQRELSGSTMFHTKWGESVIEPGGWLYLEGSDASAAGWFPPILNCGNQVVFTLTDSHGESHALGSANTDPQWPAGFEAAVAIPPDVPAGIATIHAQQDWQFRFPFVNVCIEVGHDSSSFKIPVLGETGVNPPHILGLSVTRQVPQGKSATITVTADEAAHLDVSLAESVSGNPSLPVGTIVDQAVKAGPNTINWNVPTDLPPGLYTISAQLTGTGYSSVIETQAFAVRYGG
jgi:hypothetical protein